jgi:hypothetical protein
MPTTEEIEQNLRGTSSLDGPILTGVRAVKENLSERYDHDLERLFEHLRGLEETSGRTYVDRRHIAAQKRQEARQELEALAT